MKEFLFELIQAVATAAIPVCAAFLVQYLNKKSKQVQAQTDNLTVKELMSQVTDAVTNAVTYTSQTYVDALKKNGIFDKEAQKEALQKSLNKTISLLSESAKSALTDIYGDLDEYLTTLIEAEVRNQKPSAAKVEESTAAGAADELSSTISELLSRDAGELKEMAAKYGVATDGMETSDEIAMAIIKAILNKA